MKDNWTNAELAVARELGYSLILEGQDNAAQRVFAGLIDIDPNDAYAHFALGRLAWRKQDANRALRHLQEATRIEPTLWEASLMAARIALSRGNPNAAQQALLDMARHPELPSETARKIEQLLVATRQPARP